MIIHAAAVAKSRVEQMAHPSESFRPNVLMTLQILEAARQNKVKKVLIVNSLRAYADMEAPFKEEALLESKVPSIKNKTFGYYGLSKWVSIPAGRAYAAEFEDMKIREVVFSNLYGPNDKFDFDPPPAVPSFIKKIAAAKKQAMPAFDAGNNPGATLDLLYVDDAAELMMRVVENFGDGSFDIINGGGGRSYELREVADTVAEAVGFSGKITWSGEIKTPPMFLDTEKAHSQFDWKPSTTLSKGINNTVEWFNKNYGKTK